MSAEPSPDLIRLAGALDEIGPPPERILQIECGNGEGVLFLAREFPSARVRGTDRSAEAIREAIARIGLDPEGRVAFKHRSRRSIAYPDDFFGLVVQMRGSPSAGEVARLLQPGGHAILVPPGRLARWRLGRWLESPTRPVGTAGLYVGRLASGE